MDKTIIKAKHLVGNINFAPGMTDEQKFLEELAKLMTEYRICKLDIGLTIFDETNSSLVE